MTRSTVMVNFNGKMAENMKENGLTESNMEKEKSQFQEETKKREFGKMEKD